MHRWYFRHRDRLAVVLSHDSIRKEKSPKKAREKDISSKKLPEDGKWEY
jgi:hypothetical protein